MAQRIRIGLDAGNGNQPRNRHVAADGQHDVDEDLVGNDLSQLRQRFVRGRQLRHHLIGEARRCGMQRVECGIIAAGDGRKFNLGQPRCAPEGDVMMQFIGAVGQIRDAQDDGLAQGGSSTSGLAMARPSWPCASNMGSEA